MLQRDVHPGLRFHLADRRSFSREHHVEAAANVIRRGYHPLHTLDGVPAPDQRLQITRLSIELHSFNSSCRHAVCSSQSHAAIASGAISLEMTLALSFSATRRS